MSETVNFQEEFDRLMSRARVLTDELPTEVEDILRLGKEQPLNQEEAVSLLTKAVTQLRSGVVARKDSSGAAALDRGVDELVKELIAARERVDPSSKGGMQRREPVHLIEYNGIKPRPVKPSPVFHEREVAVNEGFVPTRDIQLWEGNERLDVHVRQYQKLHGRDPSPEEVLDIMLSKMDLAGIDGTDQFEIRALARSIAINGVREKPIIDYDGTLLDGNRRVAACWLILTSDEFDHSAKRRAEHLLVWQLTVHATDEDREAVLVSLNFEPSYKQDWPEYVKARKIYDEWKARLAHYPRATEAQMKEMKKELSKMFALGPDPRHVNRYITMVEMADDFEEYHVIERSKDEFDVKHHALRYFQYFDELSKGKKPGGVYYTLNQEPTFKNLVYDLLYSGKFRNWSQIRHLKYIVNEPDARDVLRAARDDEDIDNARSLVDDACAMAQQARAESRTFRANTKISEFVRWLEGLPVSAFTQKIEYANLKGLQRALALVNSVISEIESESERSGMGDHAFHEDETPIGEKFPARD